ncbi:MAG: PG0541 family transporter-associated protein [Paludibacteraceae bacterium]
MKTILISFDQAFKDDVIALLNLNHVRGFTFWNEVQGRGSVDGEPHYGNHAWPSLNNAILTVVDADKVQPILEALKNLDESSKMLGLRAFVWNIEEMY